MIMCLFDDQQINVKKLEKSIWNYFKHSLSLLSSSQRLVLLFDGLCRSQYARQSVTAAITAPVKYVNDG